ncbi:hypothetical protein GCM10009773_13610 [Williamsia serinedens]
MERVEVVGAGEVAVEFADAVPLGRVLVADANRGVRRIVAVADDLDRSGDDSDLVGHDGTGGDGGDGKQFGHGGSSQQASSAADSADFSEDWRLRPHASFEPIHMRA